MSHARLRRSTNATVLTPHLLRALRLDARLTSLGYLGQRASRRRGLGGVVMDDKPDRPRVYLAGPEVFFANALEQGAEKKRLAAEHGFEGVYPLDNVIDGAEHLSPQELARRISHGNERLMRSCDLLIANCTPFRSVSMDVGTAFEIGFMQALGRPVLGYSNTAADYASRVRSAAELASMLWDHESNAAAIEDFGLAENLMIAVAIREAGGEFVTEAVPPERMLSDLSGFRRCLERARYLLPLDG
jgi:nucleoside 2-deoxyribosyltransferase